VPIQDKSTTDVIIIGGGVIGLSLAWELARRGKTVVVLESKEVGRGASWAGAGILPASAKYGTTDAYEQLRALSHQLHPIWAKRLFEVTGTHTGFQQCGGLYLARSPAEAATLTANQGWWESHGIEFENGVATCGHGPCRRRGLPGLLPEAVGRHGRSQSPPVGPPARARQPASVGGSSVPPERIGTGEPKQCLANETPTLLASFCPPENRSWRSAFGKCTRLTTEARQRGARSLPARPASSAS
jgi:hypothetical protein